jgi:RNA polymerase subunit RPABC4/transcription elongation factor Spt4
MFDRFKQAANVTKFKAEQLLRVQGVQNEIAGINQQVNGLRDRIAAAVLDLHQKGPLGIPELDEICASVDALQAQIAQKEAQITAIRNEQPPQAGAPAPQASAPPPPAVEVKTCPNCHTSVPASAMFCTSCGYNFQQEPAAPEAAPEDAPATQTCPNCHFEAPATSAFCPNCGQALAH